MRRLLLLGGLLALAMPTPAFAHATLEKTSPGFAARVATSPRAITLEFSEYVKALPGSVQLFSATRPISVLVRSHGRMLEALVPHLRRGPYTVRWHAMSGDGHVVSGVFTFGVRARAPAPTDAYGASGPTRTEDVVRWLYFLSLALLVGGLGFRLLVARRPLPRRFYAVTGIGAAAALNVGIAAFILRAEGGGRPAAPLRATALRRSDADCAHAVRDGLHRHDAGLCTRDGLPLPRLAD